MIAFNSGVELRDGNDISCLSVYKKQPRDCVAADRVPDEHVRAPLAVVCGASAAWFEAQVAWDVLLNERTEILPSEDAHARIAPSSCGAHDTEFTTEP